MNKIRRFTNADWDAYAGAESFKKGQDPFIYVGSMNEGLVEVTVIADKNGIEISLIGDDGSLTWQKAMTLNSLRAEGEIRAIVKAIQNYTYAPDLSYEIDHPTKEALKGFGESIEVEW